MSNISCLKIIRDRFPSMSYSDQLIAEYALSNPSKMAEISIHELSEAIGVAPSTIVNFSKKMGYDGFRKFKIHLASETVVSASQGWPSLKETIGEGAPSYYDITALNANLLIESTKYLDQGNMRQAVAAILKAPRILIFGIGTSGILAQEAFDLFLRLGLNVSFTPDLHHQILKASLSNENDVAIVFSQSGVNKTALNLTESIKKNGAKIIGICNYAKTPFIKIVDIPLSLFSEIKSSYPGHYTFKIPIICCVETLYYMLANELGDISESAIEKTRDLIKDHSV